MKPGHSAEIPDLSPEDVWIQLTENKKTCLVDCRTEREWVEIGTPDLSGIGMDVIHVEWRQAPDMRVNDRFAQELEAALADNQPETIFFICRSGARSKEAATFMSQVLSSKSIGCACVNVAEGFEGTQRPDIIAAGTSGWRNKRLPWTHK